jgi:hypothetical protein
VEQRSSSEDNIQMAGEEIPFKFYGTKMFSTFSQNPTTGTCLKPEYFSTNPHILLFYGQFSQIPPVSAAEFVYIFLSVPYSCFISLPSRLARLDTSNNNWRRARFKRLLIMWFSTCKRGPSFERKPPCAPE